MNIRKASLAVAVAALIAVGSAGCSFITPDATQKTYNASDGIDVTAGAARISNLALVADKDGNQATLIGQISDVNGASNDNSPAPSEGTDITVKLTTTTEGISIDKTWTLAKGQAINLQDAGQTVTTSLGSNNKPGSTVKFTVTVTDSSGTATTYNNGDDAKTMPILSANDDIYATVAPGTGAGSSASPSASPSGSAEPSASPSAE